MTFEKNDFKRVAAINSFRVFPCPYSTDHLSFGNAKAWIAGKEKVSQSRRTFLSFNVRKVLKTQGNG
jgi:hypothetical protein